jgi:hypothetical protein
MCGWSGDRSGRWWTARLGGTVWVDCDVLQADGDADGSRSGPSSRWPPSGGCQELIAAASAIQDCVAAISVGVVSGRAPRSASRTPRPRWVERGDDGLNAFVEVQGGGTTFGRVRLGDMLALSSGHPPLVGLQQRVLGARVDSLVL